MRLCILLLSCLLLMAGCSPSFLITPVANVNELEERNVEPGSGWFPAKVAIIPVEGMILNARQPGLLDSGENPVSIFKQQIDRAAADPRVKAVVLRINSPGGSVTASDTIYRMLLDFRCRTGKPIVASAQELAASGAYYVALASDRIVANPTTVVGSIGVVFTSFDFEGTLGKIGARSYTIKSGQFKDMGSPFKQMTREERELLQNMIDQYFARFRAIVLDRRHLAADVVPTATDGRVFTGEDALRFKLIDQLGTLNDAINVARELGHAAGASAVLYIRPYGYGGSIYASNQIPPAESKGTTITLPTSARLLAPGFYYLWEP